jgi:hypothetical protein
MAMAGFGGITTRKDLDGSRYEWVLAGPLYLGNRAGICMYYPDFQGH